MEKDINNLRVFDSISKHRYDIELKELLVKAKKKRNDIFLLEDEQKIKRYDEYLKGLVFLIHNYCQNKIDFDKSIGVVFDTKKNINIYPFYLSYALMHNEIHDTEIFLNHHLKKFTSGKKIDFVNFIKFRCKDIIEGVNGNIFDTRELLDRMLKWAVEKEEKLERTLKPELSEVRFIFKENNKQTERFIEMLSGELKKLGYTDQKKGFLNLFFKPKKIVWRGEIAFLVYLIHCLMGDQEKQYPKYITTTKGENKKWDATINYFEIYDSSGEKITCKYLSDVLYAITKRAKMKYKDERSSVDRMITSINRFILKLENIDKKLRSE